MYKFEMGLNGLLAVVRFVVLQMGKTKLEIGEDEAGQRGSASNVIFQELHGSI